MLITRKTFTVKIFTADFLLKFNFPDYKRLNQKNLIKIYD